MNGKRKTRNGTYGYLDAIVVRCSGIASCIGGGKESIPDSKVMYGKSY
jgi:hypothetical protein